MFELGGIEMAARFRDQAGIVNLPQFVASDPNAISCSCVGAGQRPVECGSVFAWLQSVEGDDHVRKIPHEVSCDFRSRSRGSAIHGQRGVLGEERRYAFWILTAPRLCVALRKF